jgi:aryl-alcohol dehydrogenase-like predicted oxidoreductase
MNQRRIGSLDVSVVGLGCNNFGGRCDAAATQRVVDAALEAGITLFDTADIYGGTASEVLLGKALGKRRDQIVLATKFGVAIDGKAGGGSAAYVRSAVEASLRRLGTDRIDLYQLHRPDPATPIAETLGALDELVRAGKLREIGCSNFTVDQLREAKRAAIGAQFVCVQNELSLLHRDDATTVIPECEREGLAYLPYFPLASGMLTGKYRGSAGATATGRLASGGMSDRFRTPANAAIVEQLSAIAERHGRSILELAFGWLLALRPVASVIAGATTAEQVRANVDAAGWQLDDGVLADVRAVLR